METGQEESGDANRTAEDNSAVETAEAVAKAESSAALSSLTVESAPPTPTSIPPASNHQFTSEDTIKMDTSQDRKDDDISLIVHVDESQNDLDNDLDAPDKKAAAEAGAATEDTTAAGDKSSTDTNKVDSKSQETGATEVMDTTESATEKKDEKTAASAPAAGDKEDSTAATAPTEGNKATPAAAAGDKSVKRFVSTLMYNVCRRRGP